MTSNRRAPARTLLALSLAAAALAPTACGGSTGASARASAAATSAAPTGSPAARTLPVSPTAVPGTDATPPASAAAGQTDTDWGRIWDTLPASFPRYPGSIPTQTGAGPTSGEFAVLTDATTAAGAMQSALEGAAYSTEAQSGPLEDGSIVIDSIGENPACRVETKLAPLGSTTVMTVLYGAACPAP